jgi:nucleotide-binding universal stress UspA family protein
VAAAIAARLDDTLLVVHSVEMGEAGAIWDGSPAQAIARTKTRLEKQAESLREYGAMIRTEVVIAGAAEAIVARAATRGTRLVIVGSLGRRALERWRLGSVSEQVAERSVVPTLVVRQEQALVAWARDGRPLKVVCAYNFDATSDAALAGMKQLRRIGPCEILVVQVDWPLGEKTRLGVQAMLERDLKAKIDSVLGEKGVSVRVESSLGRPDFRLIEIAREEQVDLVVTGTHQRHGWSRAWHASTSRGLLHDAPMSVLVVPVTTARAESSVPRLRRILVTTDFSELGNQAIPYAFSLAQSGAAVRLLYVKPPTSPLLQAGGRVAPSARSLSVPSIPKWTRWERQLRALMPAEIADMGISCDVEVIENREPATAICQAAERFNADVVCLASHGRSGLSAAILGSVANGVMAGSKRPLLLVRPAAS